MRKRILILGSDTKSGEIAFKFFKEYPQKFRITGLSCFSSDNIKKFLKQAEELNLDYLFVNSEKECHFIEDELDVSPYFGDSICKFTKFSDADIVVFALPGIDSVKIVLSAIAEFKDICFVNFDPIFYSGNIIIDDAQNKGVSLYPIALKLYSADLFLKGKDLNSIKYLDLFLTLNKPEEDYLTIPKKNTFEEFKENFYKDFKLDLIETIFCLNYFFDIPVTKIKFFSQNLSLLNLSVSFEQGNTLINSTTYDLYNVFNYYFLDYSILKNKNLAKSSELKELDYSLKKIDISNNLALYYGIKSLEMGGNTPILNHICTQICLLHLYNGKLIITDFPILFDKILFNKNLKVNHPDLKTILALYKKVERIILNYIKNKNTYDKKNLNVKSKKIKK